MQTWEVWLLSTCGTVEGSRIRNDAVSMASRRAEGNGCPEPSLGVGRSVKQRVSVVSALPQPLYILLLGWLMTPSENAWSDSRSSLRDKYLQEGNASHLTRQQGGWRWARSTPGWDNSTPVPKHMPGPVFWVLTLIEFFPMVMITLWAGKGATAFQDHNTIYIQEENILKTY